MNCYCCAAETYTWPVLLLLSCCLLLILLWWYISHHNQYTYDVLYSGWTPIIGAMIISRSVLESLILTLLNLQFRMDFDWIFEGQRPIR